MDNEPDSKKDEPVQSPVNGIHWNDLLINAITLPKLAQRAKEEIEYYLGYLPADHVIIPFEPFLRALIEQMDLHKLSPKYYDQLAEQHVRLIRNKECAFNLMQEYDSHLYKRYYNEYLPHGRVARQRIADILGYSPELSCSLLCELYLRELLANDEVQLPKDKLTPFDFKLVGLIRYREVLITNGKEAADNWPVLRYDPMFSENCQLNY